MYLRGDISILVPAVFSEIVAILTAPAVFSQSLAKLIGYCPIPKCLNHSGSWEQFLTQYLLGVIFQLFYQNQRKGVL